MGFWAVVREVWPETREQRCWVHRLVNVLDKLPKRLQPKAKQALHGASGARPHRPACRSRSSCRSADPRSALAMPHPHQVPHRRERRARRSVWWPAFGDQPSRV
jgi:hypothetical protein